uniref:Gustatory receptor 4 n=1 Tax=Pyrrhalta aenescens TaxID=281545 RepID=A0A1J0KKV8_9CUCU|nr:gustatory receptor 4 [Pyrrhalta aenescens]
MIYRNSQLLLSRTFFFYYTFLTATVIYNMALSLRNCLVGLKIYIVKSLGVESSVFLSETKSLRTIMTPISVIGEETFWKLLEASKIFNIIFECVEIFNDIFGVLILFFNVVTVLIILVSLNTLLITGEMEQLTVEVAIDSISVCLMFIIWNSFVTSACGLLKRESVTIITLCCKLQHALPHGSKERQEILNLARQINRKSPRVTAAGFCDVDFSLIFSIFSCVGTYIVVLIQFSHIDF